jgi:hypothetical protein
MRYDEDDEDEGPKADPTLEQGMPLPIRLNAVYSPELTAVPIEDIDPYYKNQRVRHVAIHKDIELDFSDLYVYYPLLSD